MLAGEGVPRLIGIDDGSGGGQLLPRQMVIGDNHLHAQLPGPGDAADTADTVVHRQQQLRSAPGGHIRQLRR